MQKWGGVAYYPAEVEEPTLEDVMRRLEWDNMGVRVDGRLLHHLRFADDIVLITPSISQAERMLADFDDACGKIGLQLNLTKTMFMRNGWIPDAPFSLNGTTISECSSYVYLGREVNMMNDLAPELGRRKRAAWGAYKSIEDVVKKTKNIRLRAHLFNTTVLPALTYASETWALRKQDENAVSVIERSIERVMLGMTRLTQVRAGIRSSTLRQQSKIRDAAVYAKSSKIRWAGHVMRLNDHRWTRAVSDWTPRNVKRTTGRPPTRWSDFFTKSFKERYDALRVSRTDRTHWTTLARERDKWKDCWRPLGSPDDQRESRIYIPGTRLGGGKGSIQHYVTPVKAKRIILEVGGHITEIEAKSFLLYLCERFSFPVEFVSEKILAERREAEKEIAEHNQNPFNWDRVLKYNMQNCTSWLSRYDIEWKGRYR
ncbi:hypothetical protein Y032_0053g2348 [Ancylostoma ceylanicum]|uniref:Reverse transcriptase domain-containing protein n=1 Tax=Ancylostoma ceylanicum TaxID=53326 RepID=A0A016U8D3_9BILA|nr:hypothetical protein Y032_0053g2348 [Ancylostoma ceylanicum]